MLRQNDRYWSQFWGRQKTGLHHSASAAYYAWLSAEISLLMPPVIGRSVLDIGCGSGELYSDLGFAGANRYRGVDISPSMLEKFRERFHGADLVCSPADSYLGEEKYDLVFSNAVVQYLGKSKLSLMIDNMSRMLNPRGVIVLGMIPWKSLKTAYYSGDIARSHTPFLTRLARFVKTRIRDQMGNWYAWEDLRRIAEKHGLEAFFYGSLTDPYRFHVVLLRTSEFSGQQDEFTQRLFASRRR